ncbi:hypothetical protein [Niallia sp. BSM11]|uniref:YqgU-like beta propeller domain-containing protein n=1 Tax=Niallia sp. BSM11 TaxID=3391576 RepID=UPI003984E134
MTDLSKRNAHGFFLLLLIFTLVLSGCSHKQKETTSKEEEKDNQKKEKIQALALPMEVDNGEFVEVSGWLDTHTICYITSKGNSYYVYTFDIYSGQHKLLYTSDSAITAVKISPDLSKLLVFTNEEDFQGNIVLMNKEGKQLFSKQLQSYDAEFVWNPYDEDQVLVSSFTKEWASTSYLLSIKNEKFQEVELDNPFIVWADKETVAYLGWKEETSLSSPVTTKNIKTGEQTVISENNAYSIGSNGQEIFTISDDSQDMQMAQYTFYDKLNAKAAISLPRLSNYSDWLIPYNDAADDQLFTFYPESSGDATNYTEGYSFVSIDTGSSGEKPKVIKEGLENEPISISPDGKWALYGFYLEKLINLETGEVIPLS